MSSPFTNKISLVTGGASGLGRALCQELAAQGAIVVVTDVDEEGAKKVADDIILNRGRATAVTIDVSSQQQVQQVVNETARQHGRLDYLFNNAGIAVMGESRDISLERWRRVIDINLQGVIYGVNAAYSLMIRQGSGHIVNIASSSGLFPYSLCVPYATSKHGIVGLSTSLRAEALDLGVNVSVVCPGPIDTNIFDPASVMKVKDFDLFSKMPMMSMKSSQAAGLILKGVAGNQAMIVFPAYIRLVWWLYRIHPGFRTIWNQLTVIGFRKFIRDVKG